MTRLTHIASLFSLLVVLLLGTASCGDNSCYDNGNSLPLATFYVGDSQQTVSGLTIMGIGVPGDSLLADSSSLKEIYLPLRTSVTTTAYKVSRWITISDTKAQTIDTITFDYQPIEFFHSIECGTMFNFDIKRLTYTTNGIDSVVLLTPLVTNSPTPALRIHFTNFN